MSGLLGPQNGGTWRQQTSKPSKQSLRGREGPCRDMSSGKDPMHKGPVVRRGMDSGPKAQRAPPWQSQERHRDKEAAKGVERMPLKSP